MENSSQSMGIMHRQLEQCKDLRRVEDKPMNEMIEEKRKLGQAYLEKGKILKSLHKAEAIDAYEASGKNGCITGTLCYVEEVESKSECFKAIRMLESFLPYYGEGPEDEVTEGRILFEIATLYEYAGFMEESCENMRRAAEEGYAPAMNMYANYCRLGIGMPRSYPLAEVWDFRYAVAIGELLPDGSLPSEYLD